MKSEDESMTEFIKRSIRFELMDIIRIGTPVVLIILAFARLDYDTRLLSKQFDKMEAKIELTDENGTSFGKREVVKFDLRITALEARLALAERSISANQDNIPRILVELDWIKIALKDIQRHIAFQ